MSDNVVNTINGGKLDPSKMDMLSESAIPSMTISKVTNNMSKAIDISNITKEPMFPKSEKRYKSSPNVEPTPEDETVAKSIAPLIKELYPKIKQTLYSHTLTTSESLDLIIQPLKGLNKQLGHLSIETIKMFIHKFNMIPPSMDPDWYKPGMPQDLYKDQDFLPGFVKDDLMAGWIAYNIKY
jgi:hypothetical protein